MTPLSLKGSCRSATRVSCKWETHIPLGQAVLDVVEGGVDKHARVVPSAGLDANRLVDKAALGEVLVRDGDG